MDTDQSSDALYAAWVDYSPTSPTTGHGAVTIERSDDHGQSWQRAGTVDVPGRTAFQPSLAVARQGAAPAPSTTRAPLVLGFSALRDVPAGTPPVTGAVDYLPFVAASADGGASWSAPTTPSGAGASDPAASVGRLFASGLAGEFLGDYSGLSGAPDGKTFFFAYTSAQEGSTCAAIDAYRTGSGPQPNIYTSCPPTFGNTDIHVATVTKTP
jgi:hypothetical protein